MYTTLVYEPFQWLIYNVKYSLFRYRIKKLQKTLYNQNIVLTLLSNNNIMELLDSILKEKYNSYPNAWEYMQREEIIELAKELNRTELVKELVELEKL